MTGTPRWGIVLVLVMVAGLAACGDDDGGSLLVPPTASTAAEVTSTAGGGGTVETAAPETTAAAETTAAETTAPPETAAPPETTSATSCDQPAVLMQVGDSIEEMLVAVDAPYPANARYFCFAVGEGVGRITIDLTGFTTDLDLYVGFGSISSVQGVDLTGGDTYEWLSNEFGEVDERVVIDAPEPGVYYIEVVPYEGESSPYTLTVTG